MILPDVNVLVYAFHADATAHARYRPWLLDVVNGPTELALTDATLIGFIRLVTNPRVFEDPAPTGEAVEFASRLTHARGARWLANTAAAWDRFEVIASNDRHVRANLIPDAWLAALAISNGCRLATADRGFARFEGLDWFDPAA